MWGSVSDSLDDFCRPVSDFWKEEAASGSGGSYSGSGSGRGSSSSSANLHDEVDFSLCFEDTAILYGVCLVAWVLGGLTFLCAPYHKKSLRISSLHLAKLGLMLVVLVAAFCDLFYTVYQQSVQQVAEFQYVTPIVLALTMGLMIGVLTTHRMSGVKSSGLPLVFWLVMMIYAALKMRTLVLVAEDNGSVKDVFRFTTFCVQFASYVGLFVLTLLPEPHSRRHSYTLLHDGTDQRKPCPELEATFLSRITWWWLNGLIWDGWRKPLLYSDLTDLNEEDKAKLLGPRFQMNWDKELKKSDVTFTRVPVKQMEYQPVNVEIRPTSGESGLAPEPAQGPGGHNGRGPSLVLALAKSFGGTFVIAGFFKLGQDLLGFASPQILKLMISFTEDPSEADWRGYLYAVLLFVVAVIQSLLLHQYFHRGFLVGMRVRTAVISAIYNKALRLSNSARRERTVGEIVNLMSVDAQRFMDLMSYLHMIWSAPLQIVLALVFLYFTMGFSIFAGFAVMILLIPINAVIAAKSRKLQVKQMIQKDSRIKLVNEVLNGMKVIKLYAWEIPFKQQIMGIRQGELSVLRSTAFLNAGSSFTWTCAPFLVALATFATFVLVNKDSSDPNDRLTADKAFVALSLFNILRFPLSMLPMLISYIVESSVSVTRLREFLKGNEIDSNNVERSEEPATEGENVIAVNSGEFTWDTGDKSTLEDINIRVKRGQLVGVVGLVGAGKSSLIQAILGEMEKVGGTVEVKGRVAYVPQQAWIRNATVRENIEFGRAYNEVLYKTTLQDCALEQDLEILPGGDMTEIGEKGINLSGGQKQRVSLARAVYQEADIYLLDDPLSAVDSHVGKHIFEKVIGPEGVLRGKTRFLVTHGIGFLPQCDQIIVMEGGRITEAGAYSELIDADGNFAEFIRTFSAVEENEEGDPLFSEYTEYEDEMVGEPVPDDSSTLVHHGLYDDDETRARRLAWRKHHCKSRETSFSKPELKRGTSRTDLIRQLSKQKSILEQQAAAEEKEAEKKNVLITEERAETGSVKMSVVVAYMKACTFSVTGLVVLFYVFTNGSSVGSNFWLAHWSNQESAAKSSSTDIGLFLGVYAALGFSQALFVLFAAFALAMGGILASKKLHNSMLDSIMRSPMSFFDTTPLGRILNRFSKDVYTIDETIPRSLRGFIMTVFTVVSTIIVILIATPIFAVVIIPLGFLYAFIQRFYVATSRQLKRLESITRSPIYTHFQESVTGASSIRAYGQQVRFIEESERRVDNNQIAYYPSICANRWLAIRLEFIGNLIILFAALFAVIQRIYGESLHMPISAGLVGLSISYALQVTQSLNMMVRMTSELETNIVAVERTKEYADTENEAPAIVPDNRPPDGWPTHGHVKFDHYSTRYREGLDLVIRDIQAEVPGGTKVGIVGRTGAGKSSLTLALFRIIEPASGSIVIDQCNVAALGLQDLRSRITIIPQDPVLFSGTLRVNLDPFESYSDQEVWAALESSHLKAFVTSLPEKLLYPIAEGGENLSVGQRQLVCLARALLRKTKILVLDEATAAVDLETDDLIQKTIRSEFADCTILTIAHRLNTIMDYDRILVLDAGQVKEFAAPNELLSNKKSSFYSMAKDAGLVA